CVLATNIIDLRLKYAKVAALGSSQAPQVFQYAQGTQLPRAHHALESGTRTPVNADGFGPDNRYPAGSQYAAGGDRYAAAADSRYPGGQGGYSAAAGQYSAAAGQYSGAGNGRHGRGAQYPENGARYRENGAAQYAEDGRYPATRPANGAKS